MATQNAEMNDRVAHFVGELLVKIVSDGLSVPQAVAKVNKFADALPYDQQSVARADLMDYVFRAQETMQTRWAKNAKAMDGGVESLLQTMRKCLLNGSISLTQAMGLADQAADEAKRVGISEDGLYRLKARMSEFLLACQAEKEQRPRNCRNLSDDELTAQCIEDRKAGRGHDTPAFKEAMRRRGPAEITWLDDPANLGLNIPWTPPSQDDWMVRLWRSIKAQLPPHMIDTPEKEKEVANDVGFLIGFWGERGAYRILRTIGIVP